MKGKGSLGGRGFSDTVGWSCCVAREVKLENTDSRVRDDPHGLLANPHGCGVHGREDHNYHLFPNFEEIICLFWRVGYRHVREVRVHRSSCTAFHDK